MKIWDVDLVTLTDICVAWEDKIPRRVIQNITNRYNRYGCWAVVSSAVNVGNYVKPGSTGIIAFGRSNGTIIDRGVDPWKMGWWSYIVIAGKKSGISLLVIIGYRTGKRSDTLNKNSLGSAANYA